jgi:hypothetical protein
MSITTPVSQTVASHKRRTWRVNIETPNGGTPVISGYREQISLDASGAQVGPSAVSQIPLALALDAATVAALPAKYQPLPGLISAFFDDFDSGALESAIEAYKAANAPVPAPEPAAAAPAAQ